MASEVLNLEDVVEIEGYGLGVVLGIGEDDDYDDDDYAHQLCEHECRIGFLSLLEPVVAPIASVTVGMVIWCKYF